MEFVKGELSVKDTNEHGDYYIGNKDSYSYIAIVVAEVLSPENSAEEYAQEFVRRWNAFEKDGLVDELRAACKRVQQYNEAAEKGRLKGDENAHEYWDSVMSYVEAAIAKSKA